MINSSLCRTALAAAVVASLCLPAAANGDAAFASALGNIPSLLATTASLKTLAQIPVATAATPPAKGPTAPADIWKKILDSVSKERAIPGSPLGQISRSRSAEIKNSDQSATHHSVTAFSAIRQDGEDLWGVQFVISEFNMAAETGLIQVDHWVFGVRSGGMLFQAAHYTNSTGKEVPIDQMQVEKLDLADLKTKARYDEMLKFWSTH